MCVFLVLRLVFADSISDTPQKGYHAVSSGELGTLDFKINLFADGKPISPWHDIPFYPSEKLTDDLIYNFVCEIPRKTTEKMEMIKEVDGNPIMQDTKTADNGTKVLRHITFLGGAQWNYGFLTQTYEDPDVTKDEHFGPLGEGVPGDGDPVDVIMINDGSEPCKRGDVMEVSLVGALALLDSGERDWKLLALPKEQAIPADYKEQLKSAHYWFTHYKGTNEDGTPKNKIALEVEKKKADMVALETHFQWLAKYGLKHYAAKEDYALKDEEEEVDDATKEKADEILKKLLSFAKDDSAAKKETKDDSAAKKETKDDSAAKKETKEDSAAKEEAKEELRL